jgi:hypothetical protein
MGSPTSSPVVLALSCASALGAVALLASHEAELASCRRGRGGPRIDAVPPCARLDPPPRPLPLAPHSNIKQKTKHKKQK